ncbi:MAG TPA: HEAT repeat domain-containing protein [Acidobacteriota bacterium]|nr:HEAT repeat domain-containing protein [Acidobacteriota bacterium]
MRHQKFKEWIPLLVYDELDDAQRALTEKHLATCAECRQQLEEIKELTEVAGAAHEPPDDLLRQARRELRIALRHQHESSRGWIPKWNWRVLVPSYQTAIAGVVCLALGLVIGRFYDNQSPGEHEILQLPVAGQLSASSNDDISIGNIRFIDADATDGDVEFTYEATKPVRVRGSINDPAIQNLLSVALIEAQNPGVRLRAVNVLNTDQLKQPDDDIKRALITALKTDENNGVRRQALAALQNFPYDKQVRDALLYVLNHDSNPAMRIAAIDAISARHYVDPEVLRVLEEKMYTDGNEYIRFRSRAVVQEAKQQ